MKSAISINDFASPKGEDVISAQCDKCIKAIKHDLVLTDNQCDNVKSDLGVVDKKLPANTTAHEVLAEDLCNNVNSAFDVVGAKVPANISYLSVAARSYMQQYPSDLSNSYDGSREDDRTLFSPPHINRTLSHDWDDVDVFDPKEYLRQSFQTHQRHMQEDKEYYHQFGKRVQKKFKKHLKKYKHNAGVEVTTVDTHSLLPDADSLSDYRIHMFDEPSTPLYRNPIDDPLYVPEEIPIQELGYVSYDYERTKILNDDPTLVGDPRPLDRSFWKPQPVGLYVDYGVTFEYLADIYESAVILMTTLSGIKEDFASSTAAAFILFAKCHCINGSITMHVLDWLFSTQGVTTSLGIPVVGEFKPQAGFLDGINLVFSNWNMFRQSPLFKMVGRLLALCVAAGLCSQNTFKIDLGKINLFSVQVLDEQASATDLFDCFVKTAEYLVNAGMESFKTGSLRPFLFSNQRMQRLDTLFFAVRTAMSVLPSGNLDTSSIKTEAELYLQLKNLLNELELMKQVEKDKFVSNLLTTRLGMAHVWMADFLTKTKGGSLRVAPYTFLIYGTSGIGKSFITQQMSRDLLCSNHFEHTDTSKTVTINCASKFMDNVKSDTLCLIFDDMGNEAGNNLNNHARPWLDCSNNVQSYANMASVEQKGSVFYNHKLQIGTSNLKDGGMDKFSAYKAANARRGTRDHIVLKPAFLTNGTIDSSKIVAAFPEDPYPDIYDITVEQAVEDPLSPGNYTYRVETFTDHNGVTILMKNVSYRTYVMYHVTKSKAHFATQDIMVKKMKAQPMQVNLCVICDRISTLCTCATPTVRMPVNKNQAGVDDVTNYVYSRVGRLVVTELSYQTMNGAYFEILRMFPNFIRNHYIIQSLFHVFSTWCITPTFFASFSAFLHAIGFVWRVPIVFLLLTLLLCLIVYVVVHDIHARNRQRDYALRRFAICDAVKLTRGFVLRAVAGLAVLTGALVMFRRMYNMKKKFSPQGNLSPQTMEQCTARNDEVNMWKRVERPVFNRQDASLRVTTDMLRNRVFNNVLYCVVERNGRRLFSNAVMVETARCLMPRHMLTNEPSTFTFYRKDPTVVGATFRANICLSDAICKPDSDLALVYVTSGGDFKSLKEYLPETIPQSGHAKLVYKNKDGLPLNENYFSFYVGDADIVESEMGKGYTNKGAIKYTLPHPSFSGLCCGVVLFYGPKPAILGFHSFGADGSNEGGASTLTIADYNQMCSRLMLISGTLPLAASGTIMTCQYGIDILQSEEVHVKSPLRFLPAETTNSVQVFGSTGGRVKLMSEVKPTLIADYLEMKFNYPRLWGQPKFYLGRHYRDHLLKCSCPSLGCTTTLLSRAVEDYMLSAVKVLAISDLVKDTFPLDWYQTINGRDGIRFVDRMPLNTSMGFPLNKPKRDFVKLVNVERDDIKVVYDFTDPAIREEFDKCESAYKQNTRYYHVFQASCKDVATKLTSNKVRIFQAAPIVLQLMVRKYFLPIARLFSTFPLQTECAVGINCHSDEWQQLMDHVRSFKNDRFITCDYEAYDARMPSQFTIAAFSVLIKVAEYTNNYTADDLQVMRAMVADVVYPVMTFNGDYIQLLGTNPSGQNLTVYINSIANSLYFRCVYYYDNNVEEPFTNIVKMITYGDDVVAGVGSKGDDFTFQKVRRILATMDVVVTPADKSDPELAPDFVTSEHVDFLKRKSRFISDLGYEVGVLDESSILRSLVTHIPSKEQSDLIQMGSIIDSALTEWFYYGSEHFEFRRRQMHDVCTAFNIHCTSVAKTYAQRMNEKLGS